VWAVPRLGELYPGICLATEEKARKNLSLGSRVNDELLLLILKTLEKRNAHSPLLKMLDVFS